MTQCREVLTCTRCREAKRKCDKTRPNCFRCERASVSCYYDDTPTENIPSPGSTPDGPTLSISIAAPRDRPRGDSSVKRRARACLSCTRCHRLKIKCDKKQPCGRCVTAICDTTCIYTHRAKPAAQQTSVPAFIFSGEDPEFVVATWFLRRRGSSHWKALLDRLESLSCLNIPPFDMAMREHIAGDCSSDFALPGNFPCGSIESAPYVPLNRVIELLQTVRSEADALVTLYFEFYHPALPVLVLSTFKTKTESFWRVPDQADASWLAQYLVVLGLGAYASGRDHAACADLFYASEACLARTSYMFRPTTTHISTLCLMVLAKQAVSATCWALDTCWNVMGLVVRLSMMTMLHQEWMPDIDEPVIIRERDLRRRLWTVVVFLDTQMSLITGQQSLLPQDALLITTEARIPCTIEDTWTTVLPQSFPIICHFLARINLQAHDITNDEVLQYDLQIRRLLSQIKDLPGNAVSRLTIDCFFRRALLVLHRRHGLNIDAPQLYPTSYWSSLEGSLAMIGHYRNLSGTTPLDLNGRIIGRPYMLDFFAAALTTCVHLLRHDSGTMFTPEESFPGRNTILSTLRDCLRILSNESNSSLCFRTGFRLLTAVYKLLPAE